MCDRCLSTRVASVSAKCSDMCFYEPPEGEPSDGYVPRNAGIGAGDYVDFGYCLDCGKIQGNFPVTPDLS